MSTLSTETCVAFQPAASSALAHLQETAAIILIVFLVLLSRASAQRWHASAVRSLPRAHAQPLQDMAHMSWTRRDGAPTDIAALAQTTDGYLWIGSSFGLFRFDGTRFESYPFSAADPRLPASNIAALAADRNGGLWVGFRMGGISYLRNGSIVSYGKSDGLVGQSTEQLLCREDGSTWAIADGLMVRFDGTRWETYSRTHGLTSDGLYSVLFDRGGNLWTADKGHIFELRNGEASFSTTNLPDSVINQFVQLPNGALWMSDAWKSVRPVEGAGKRFAVKIPGVPVLLTEPLRKYLAGERVWRRDPIKRIPE